MSCKIQFILFVSDLISDNDTKPTNRVLVASYNKKNIWEWKKSFLRVTGLSDNPKYEEK